nr:hypothetical protein [uncultured Sulfurimonas sp.]
MKHILIFVLVLQSLLMASNLENDEEIRKKRIEQQIKKEMAKEKKYAKEQTFYTEENYDLEGAKVNEDSLSSVPTIEDDYEFNMDHAYD